MAERMVKESAFDTAIEAWSDRIDKDEIVKRELRNEIAELKGKNERLEDDLVVVTAGLKLRNKRVERLELVQRRLAKALKQAQKIVLIGPA